ncbi:TrmH family RNA methyltransferase [Megasphaera massiliensis]|uniref:TrmH family RNA methyltransferase n=1 Tax=Megasphaera massiliensis TaxID=1232428 RepID=UPI00040229A0|nr:RNA methyltransferase [Megasphaera massiliensis]MBS6256701.1 RNA methyltransferase [Megasphaera sp.]
MNEIVSRDNQWVKMACSLKQKKGRQAHRRVFVEGLRVIGDAAVMGIPDAICFVSPKGRELAGFDEVYARGLELGWTFYAVTDSVYDKLKDTKTPQGLAAMLPFFAYTFDALPAVAPEKAVLYLRSVQDPGNLGTILRTAAAANVGAVLLSEGCVDVYNDKTVRSAMGAIFKVPVVQDVTDEQLDQFCSDEDRNIYGTAAEGTVSYVEADYDRPVILAFGNEGNGLPDEFLECCDDVLTIPMRPDTESLNLSMAVGIVLYKAWEKNGFHV